MNKQDNSNGVWRTINGRRVFIRKKETTYEAIESGEYIRISKQEYAILCSIVRTRYGNKIPKKGIALDSNNCYIYTYNKRKELILCVEKFGIVGNEDIVQALEDMYDD